MFPVSGTIQTPSGGGGGGTPPNLSAYVTSTQLTQALLGKSNTGHQHADLYQPLGNYATTEQLNGLGAGGAVFLDDSFTLDTPNRVYVVRSSSTSTSSVNLNLTPLYDEPGNGCFLVYNASQYTPFIPRGDGDSVFKQVGQPDVYYPGPSATLPVGRWMAIWRTDNVTSGTTVIGGSNPAACYRITLL